MGCFLLYIETYAKGRSLLCVWKVCNSFNGNFSAKSNPLFISVTGSALVVGYA